MPWGEGEGEKERDGDGGLAPCCFVTQIYRMFNMNEQWNECEYEIRD